MLERYDFAVEDRGGFYSIKPYMSDDGDWVRYEDAQALELRIAELEQQLKTPEQKRAEFEAECG